MEMTAKEFKEQYCQPLVYAWKRGEQYLHIGHAVGYRRMLAFHLKFKPELMEDTDTIEIYSPFQSKKEAARAEREMQSRYHPLYDEIQGRGSLRYYTGGDGDDNY